MTRRGKTDNLTKAWIAYIRKDLGLKQYELAELIGVSLKTVSRWEAGANQCAGPAAILLMMLGEKKPGVIDLCRAKRALIQPIGD